MLTTMGACVVYHVLMLLCAGITVIHHFPCACDVYHVLIVFWAGITVIGDSVHA